MKDQPNPVSLRGPLLALAKTHEKMAKDESNAVYRKRRRDLAAKAKELAAQEPESNSGGWSQLEIPRD